MNKLFEKVAHEAISYGYGLEYEDITKEAASPTQPVKGAWNAVKSGVQNFIQSPAQAFKSTKPLHAANEKLAPISAGLKGKGAKISKDAPAVLKEHNIRMGGDKADLRRAIKDVTNSNTAQIDNINSSRLGAGLVIGGGAAAAGGLGFLAGRASGK